MELPSMKSLTRHLILFIYNFNMNPLISWCPLISWHPLKSGYIVAKQIKLELFNQCQWFILQVIWSCLVEDSTLFFKYFMEKLTRDHQAEMFQIIKGLIRFIPKLPQRAAFTLYNSIIGYIMFYVRNPREHGDDLIGYAMSILWMVVHSVLPAAYCSPICK